MIIIVGKWDRGYFCPLDELIHWEAIMRCFGLTKLAMTPVSGILSENIELEEYNSLDEILTAYPDYKKIFLESPLSAINHTELKDYVFIDEDLMFIFGNSSGGNAGHITEDDKTISITTPEELDLMFGFHILGMVLYDKMLKT